MEQISKDWEVVSRQTCHRWITSFFMILVGLLNGDPGFHSSATWTVRQKSTGIIRKVTARNKSEAADKIANGQFDRS